MLFNTFVEKIIEKYDYLSLEKDYDVELIQIVMSTSNTTTDHEVIKNWIEQRGGKPAIVQGTEENDEGAGLLRVLFSSESSDRLKEIDWDTFFQTFDDKDLNFLYQDKTKEGKESRFFKFVQKD